MATSPNPNPARYATTLLPAWRIRVLGSVLLAVGLFLPWWIIKARTQQELQHQTDTSRNMGLLRPELVLVPPGMQTPFAISATEITQGQYQRVMGQLPEGDCNLLERGENVPVSCVTWLEAVQFCNQLSKREGLAPCYDIDGDKASLTHRECEGYRLPTAAEWEYAARAGTHQHYAGTDDDTAVCRYGNVWNDPNGFTCDDGVAAVAPVRRYEPNAWFLYDMTGNVSEWISDQTTRGGSWMTFINMTRLNSRMDRLSSRMPDAGFRIVRFLTESEHRDPGQ